MYFGKISALKGLGFWEVAAGAFMSQAAKKDGSGNGGGGSSNVNTVTTSTNVTTQINPQISPTFVQQDEPQDSPVNVTTTQEPTPIPGQTPWIDNYANWAGFPPMVQEQPSSIHPGYVLAGIGLLAAAMLLPKRK